MQRGEPQQPPAADPTKMLRAEVEPVRSRRGRIEDRFNALEVVEGQSGAPARERRVHDRRGLGGFIRGRGAPLRRVDDRLRRQDDRTEAARRAREARAPSAYDFAEPVDRSPELVWEPLCEHPGDR